MCLSLSRRVKFFAVCTSGVLDTRLPKQPAVLAGGRLRGFILKVRLSAAGLPPSPPLTNAIAARCMSCCFSELSYSMTVRATLRLAARAITLLALTLRFASTAFAHLLPAAVCNMQHA